MGSFIHLCDEPGHDHLNQDGDGLLLCTDCQRPTYYDYSVEAYRHEDGTVGSCHLVTEWPRHEPLMAARIRWDLVPVTGRQVATVCVMPTSRSAAGYGVWEDFATFTTGDDADLILDMFTHLVHSDTILTNLDLIRAAFTAA